MAEFLHFLATLSGHIFVYRFESDAELQDKR